MDKLSLVPLYLVDLFQSLTSVHLNVVFQGAANANRLLREGAQEPGVAAAQAVMGASSGARLEPQV